jgi:23S rRNA (guanine2445-N2)-methyltransferase / 23S rRNA (guanine2069-N7)-methyltransferase
MSMQFFASCPRGIESLLMEELTALGATEPRSTVAGVSFGGELDVAYRVCLWSRLANRLLLQLGRFRVADADEIYRAVASLPWEEHFTPQEALVVDFNGRSAAISNTHFGALKVKDAIVDRFREQCGQRPGVDAKEPDIRVNAHLARGKLVVSLDLSGDSLHRRGYRLQGGAAPLKENLAAALLIRAKWPEVAEQGGALVDPMCGSGTLLIEGALMAAGIAPGLLRDSFGFDNWLAHDCDLWQQERKKAEAQRQRGLESLPPIIGYDSNAEVLAVALANIRDAGLQDYISVKKQSLAEFDGLPGEVTPGLLICNPPYGERLGKDDFLDGLYNDLGRLLKSRFRGWRAAVFTSEKELAYQLHLKPEKRYSFYNGRIETGLYTYVIHARDTSTKEHRPASPWKGTAIKDDTTQPRREHQADTGIKQDIEVADDLANRLRKNLRKLGKWADREKINCYRLYDADLPEYAAAIDRYDGRVHISEYAPPKNIDAALAAKRLEVLKATVMEVLAVPEDRVVLKQRKRQKGKEQYRRQQYRNEMIEVTEGPCRFLVNLHDYLDTGLFLDHRPLRQMIREWSAGKRFLNLFCYTATATVHAALGGARLTTSVDMSATYLEWARRNLELNDVNLQHHRLVQADCLEWLAGEKQRYELILLDPPSFSNSKRMETTLDIQRDHGRLIDAAAALLADEGQLVFSTNRRGFRLGEDVGERYRVRDITVDTIDMDFVRRTGPPVHQCWLIKKQV